MDSIFGLPLPVENPIAIFFIVLLIILVAPLLKRFHIPHIVGMILAGMLVGPYCLNLLPYDRSIDVFGQVGLYYIMFLAGLEIDLADLKKNIGKSAFFGICSFAVPAVLGLVSSKYLLHYSMATSLLLASMFSSHTLIAFPIISRYGLTKRTVVNIAVGGTAFAVTLSITLLAGVESFYSGDSSQWLWFGMLLKLAAALTLIFYVIPRLSKWFMSNVQDGIMRFVFVLAMAFLGALLTDFAGFQGILGAFFVGLALNVQIPKVSSLMNRIEFVGNALFFPFFLISIGMLIDLGAFLQGWQGLYVAAVMTGIVLLGKYLAAKTTQWTFKMKDSEGKLLFGLSAGRASVTLAVAMIGYNIVTGYAEDGEPVRLLNEYVFNGSVIMILIACLVSSMETEKAAKQLRLEREASSKHKSDVSRFLIPISNPKTIENLVQMSTFMTGPKDEVYALSVVEADKDRKTCSSLLDMTAQFAVSADKNFHQVMRFDTDVSTGIAQAIREYTISDVLVGLQQNLSDGNYYRQKINRVMDMVSGNLYIARFGRNLSGIRKLVLFLPEKAEYEQGFHSLVLRTYWICQNLGCPAVVYAHPATSRLVREVMKRYESAVSIEYNDFYNWQNLPLLIDSLPDDQLMLFALSRQGGVSYQTLFDELPVMVERLFPKRPVCFFYPHQATFIQEVTSYSGPINYLRDKTSERPSFQL